MTERPIIMSGDNPKLILEGIKTQTRRIVNPQPPKPYEHGVGVSWVYDEHREKFLPMGTLVGFSTEMKMGIRCPYGVAGDRLWVRETWHPNEYARLYRKQAAVSYKSGWEISDYNMQPRWKWSPSIHMPRWASRITLEITKVRVERLQDISEEDAKAEGLYHQAVTSRSLYHELWDSLHGKGAWDKNSWVWVVEFCKV